MARDVRSSLKRQVTYEKQFLHHPLLIMNGFSGDAREIQLTSSMFQKNPFIHIYTKVNMYQFLIKDNVKHVIPLFYCMYHCESISV